MEYEPENETATKSNPSIHIWQIITSLLGISLVFLLLFDIQIEPRFGSQNSTTQTYSSTQQGVVASKSSTELLEKIIPSGIPEVYGAELSISYDDVNPSNPKLADQTIETLSQYDLDLTLEGTNLERYINILFHQHGGMSCEYCCGARSIIFEDGEMACGCAHSYAMRGLTKYLILEHGEGITDDEILEEIGKWKVLFFPEIHAKKAEVMETQGITADYIALTTNVNRGIEETASGSGSMVGGC